MSNSNSTFLRATIASPSTGNSGGSSPLSIPAGTDATPQPRKSLMSDADKLGNSVVRATIIDGVASYEQLRGGQQGNNEIAPQPGQGILNGARTTSGSPVAPADVRDDTVLYFDGGSAQAKHLVAAGYVIKNADGSYSDPRAKPSTTGTPALPAGTTLPTKQMAEAAARAERAEAAREAERVEQAMQDAGVPRHEAFAEPVAEQLATQLSQDLDGSTQAAAAREFVTTGELSPRTIQEFAHQMGVDSDTASKVTGRMVEAFTAQATGVAESYGIEPSALWAWAHENHPADINKAMTQQIRGRSTAGLHSIAQRYIENLDQIDEAAILTAPLGNGVKVRKEGSKVVVETGGRSFTWKSAVRSGLIRISSSR